MSILNKRVIRFSLFIFQLMFLLTSCMIYIQDPISKKIESIVIPSPSQSITNQNIITSYDNNNLNSLKPANKIEMGYITPDIRKISGWNIAELDLGKESNIMSDLEKDILLATNMARTNPSKFSDDFIQPLLNFFEKDSNIQIVNGLRYTTEEGKDVINETIKFLKNQSPLKALEYRVGIRMSALDHVKDQGKTELTGHTGSDGSNSADRISRYGKWSITAGENIDYGNNNGLDVITALIIDDGVKSRGHRTNIFNSNYNFVGIACGSHLKYKIMCVQDLAGSYN